jgi:very-short-patch-repair endonuclease
MDAETKEARKAQQERSAQRFVDRCTADPVMGPPRRELIFHAERRWRFDFAWPAKRVALEIEGGVWTGGRHVNGAGFTKDMEKYNYAAAMGWLIIRCQWRTLLNDETAAFLRAAMNNPRTPRT